MHLGVSVVWHLSLPWMDSFNKTETAIFHMQAMLPKGFLFFFPDPILGLHMTVNNNTNVRLYIE